MTLAWTLFVLYLLGTTWLGWLGYKRTTGFGSFAIGAGDISPFQVGVTLAAATASAATFIINPGFVYVNGLSAFMHLGISVYLGFLFMLCLLSFRFRQMGESMKALTIPDWIGKRYQSNGFSLYFGIINLFSFAFVVLLVGGISIVMQKLLGIDNLTALSITLIFVTGYVLLGGTYAHVYTNMLQGILMIIISAVIVFAGVKLMLSTPDFFSVIESQNSNLLKWTNPESTLYNSIFSTYIAGFFIGAALVCQPHILTKALYVKTDKEVKQYIVIFSIIFFLFLLLLLAGFWAIVIVPESELLDPVTGAFRQDLVMTAYLQNAFPEWLFIIISVVLLAASMSTLDGLLVGISTITANDVVLNLLKRKKGDNFDEERSMKTAMQASHIVLIVIAIMAFFISLNPPKLLGIFGQVGVYGLVVAAVPPLLIGILYQKVNTQIVWVLSAIGLVIHLLLFFYGTNWFAESQLAFSNPAVPATFALSTSCVPGLIYHQFFYKKDNNAQS